MNEYYYNKTEKNRSIDFWITFGLILFVFVILLLQGIYNHNIQMEKLEEINQKIDKREVLDRAYRNHLGSCAFIDKDNTYVDKKGYIKTSYNIYGNGLSQAR